MNFKSKPPYRDVILSLIAVISLLGLLVLAFVDVEGRQAFLNMATFTVGAVVGYFIPGSK
jgi:hypothetical protein